MPPAPPSRSSLPRTRRPYVSSAVFHRNSPRPSPRNSLPTIPMPRLNASRTMLFFPPTKRLLGAQELRLRPDIFPIRRYPQFDDLLNRSASDPLTGIFAALAPDREAPACIEVTRLACRPPPREAGPQDAAPTCSAVFSHAPGARQRLRHGSNQSFLCDLPLRSPFRCTCLAKATRFYNCTAPIHPDARPRGRSPGRRG